ncbi:hypothetical protein ACFP1Z_14580 [Streptomyces gamaensis]|uniref:Aminoglycoside phosphotransferase n=1 Tax=Streptomyces gamaensis TaxID=1763542 RepID=A0ABW0Z4T6_9ACTN
MWPEPEDPTTTRRMRAAQDRAQTALGVLTDPEPCEVWGWRGRTLSQPVTSADGPSWLRIACLPVGQTDRTFWWGGSLDAERHIPASVPRPRLRACYDWNDQLLAYRAELYDRETTQPISDSPTVTQPPALTPSWWAALRTALDEIAQVPTHRSTVHQPFLERAMPRLLGAPVSTYAQSWSTAHGDFHWANICGPTLRILDWEGWGLAPTGYDAAVLHCHSLAVPPLAAQVRHELAHILDTPAGRFAELAALTQLLHSVAQGENLALAGPLQRRAGQLLGRGVPGEGDHKATTRRWSATG